MVRYYFTTAFAKNDPYRRIERLSEGLNCKKNARGVLAWTINVDTKLLYVTR